MPTGRLPPLPERRARRGTPSLAVVAALVGAAVASCGGGDRQDTRAIGVAPGTLPPVPEPEIDWSPRRYVAVRAREPVVIDGSLEDSAWYGAAWTEDFVDIRGAAGPVPRFRTRAKMMWDDRFLYIGADLEEPDVWATLTERDAVIYQDNDFEVFIDPDGDSHLYYELEINALGTEWDLLLVRPYRDGGPAIDAWDIAGLSSGVSVDGTLNDPADRDRGWSVEIAIPWAALAAATEKPSPPEPGDRWRVNFSRVQWRTRVESGAYVKVTDPGVGGPLEEDNWVWSPQGLVAMHYPEMWGFVQFSDDSGPAGWYPPDHDEAARAARALRLVYYRQRNRHVVSGSWSERAEDLDLPYDPVGGLPWPPSISLTPSGFEATLSLSDGRRAHIREDGRTWVTE